jgi:NAD(P)-dependent dehydrogenase (short-subunit alcohol dehydrogenase family)
MKDKVCIVTGCNSGIGKETALALAKLSATLIMVVRNKEKGEEAKKEIFGQSGSDSVELMICDLSSMDSIRRFATEFKKRHDRLDVLVNNAGAVFSKRELTVDGFERTLAVNYLGPVLLTHEQLDILKKSAPSRIINVSSGLANRSNIDISDLQSERDYSGMKTYSKVKLVLSLYTYELAERLKGSGVTANLALPGFVATNLGRNSGSLRSSILFKLVRPMQIRPERGAETSVYLATSDEVKDVTGKCFAKGAETSSCPMHNHELQQELWHKTMELLKLRDE